MRLRWKGAGRNARRASAKPSPRERKPSPPPRVADLRGTERPHLAEQPHPSEEAPVPLSPLLRTR